MNHLLTNFDPIDLNQSGFQANSLFICMITFLSVKMSDVRLLRVNPSKHFLVPVYSFLAAAYEVRCFFTGDSGIANIPALVQRRDGGVVVYMSDETMCLVSLVTETLIYRDNHHKNKTIFYGGFHGGAA